MGRFLKIFSACQKNVKSNSGARLNLNRNVGKYSSLAVVGSFFVRQPPEHYHTSLCDKAIYNGQRTYKEMTENSIHGKSFALFKWGYN